MPLHAISLFSSSGIGDLGLRSNDIKTVIGCEIRPERMKLFSQNFPEAKCFCGDIWDCKSDIIKYYEKNFTEPPFIILATPPCQGMSSNGMGTMLKNFRNGDRPKFDERNRLIIPAIEIIKRLKPRWVIFENVPNMLNTLIEYGENEVINIIDYLRNELGDCYEGNPSVIDVADYGVPQNRKRLITILRRTNRPNKEALFTPAPTHGKNGSIFVKPWITLRDAISELPPLKAQKGFNCSADIPLHKVPVLDEKKIFWISNTPEGQTALNNQCINPECRYEGNRTHGAKHNKDGINRSNSDTPLFCEKCGSLLPRPYTVDKSTGKKRIMKAFTSAYKRMWWDKPASTLTQNMQYACSDNKLHPSQDRVLSLYEATILQTIAPYDYTFCVDGKLVSDSLICDTIGESIPPRLMDIIASSIIDYEKRHTRST